MTASNTKDLYGKECKFRVLLNVVGKAMEASFIVYVLADMYFRTSWIPSQAMTWLTSTPLVQNNYVDINEKSNLSVSAKSKNSTAGDWVIYSDLLIILKWNDYKSIQRYQGRRPVPDIPKIILTIPPTCCLYRRDASKPLFTPKYMYKIPVKNDK